MSMVVNKDPSTFKGFAAYPIVAKNSCNYYLCIPDTIEDKRHLYLCFFSNNQHLEDKESVLKEVERMYLEASKTNKNCILAVPLIPYRRMLQAKEENDYPMYKTIKNNLQGITTDIGNRFKGNNLGINFEQILIIIQNEIDKSLADWLEMTVGERYIKGIILPKERISIEPIGFSSFDGSDVGGGNSGLNISGGKVDENVKVRTLTPPSNHHGFSNFTYFLAMYLISLVMSIITFILTKK